MCEGSFVAAGLFSNQPEQTTTTPGKKWKSVSLTSLFVSLPHHFTPPPIILVSHCPITLPGTFTFRYGLLSI